MAITVFLSYARLDDGVPFDPSTSFVTRLHRSLVAAGFDIWFDRVSMPARQLTFLQEVADAIRERDWLLFVVGPKVALSDYVRQECSWALELDKPIIPILRLGDLSHLPGELRSLHCHDFRDDLQFPNQVAKLIENLRLSPPLLAPFFGVPNLPPYFVDRPELRKVKDCLLLDLHQPSIVTPAASRVGVQGMPGIGKSVLGAAVARDRDVRRAYPDGVVWIRVGQLPDRLGLQRELAHHLGSQNSFPTEADGHGVLRQLMLKKAVLLILDDVWQAGDAMVFDVLGPRSKALITTRDEGILRTIGAYCVTVSLFTEIESLQLLAGAAGIDQAALPAAAHDIVKECERLPLAVALCGGMAKAGHSWQDILGALRDADLRWPEDRQKPNEQHRTIWNAIKSSYDVLSENEMVRFAELAVFASDTAVPEQALRILWKKTGGLNDRHCSKLLIDFAERSLVQLYQKPLPLGPTIERSFRLHDLIHDFATSLAAEPMAPHRTLLQAYAEVCPNGWASGPNDGYFLQFLTHHLLSAGEIGAVRTLLFTFAWLRTKTDGGLLHELQRDYVRALDHTSIGNEARAPLQLVLQAIRLSARVLTDERSQLPSHLLGRLSGSSGLEISGLLRETVAWQGAAWLRALFPDRLPVLRQPGGNLISSLASQGESVNCVAILDDGSLAASGGRDGSVCVWDLKSLKCLYTLVGHADEVNVVLLSSIEGIPVAISGAGKPLPFQLRNQVRPYIERMDARPSRDNTIRIWNLSDGSLRNVLEGHGAAVRSLAFHGRQLVSGSDDGTIMVWDLVEGKSLGVLGNQGSPVVLLGIIPSCSGVIAFSEYDFELWRLSERSSMGKVAFDVWTNVVAMEPDKMLIALQETSLHGGIFRLIIWDTLNSEDNCEKRLTAASFDSSFNAARFVEDGKHILVGGTDQTMRLIDIDSQEELRIYKGHHGDVTSIDVAEPARMIISGSSGGDLLLWDLDIASKEDRPGHSEQVTSIALSDDGLRAASTSADGSVMVWDTNTGHQKTLLRDSRWSVQSVALNPDGSQMLSSHGTMVSLWNVETGVRLLDLDGHGKDVTGLAFCREQTRAVSASSDRVLKLWDLKHGREECSLTAHQFAISALALFHRQDAAVTGDQSGQLIFWDLAKCGEYKRLDRFLNLEKHEQAANAQWSVSRGPSWRPSQVKQHAPSIDSLSVSPDDQLLIVAQRDRPIVVWDIRQEAEVVTLQGHTGPVFGVAVTSNGRNAVSASDDATLRVWDLSTGACVAIFTADFPLASCAANADGKTILAGEGGRSGNLLFFTLVQGGGGYANP